MFRRRKRHCGSVPSSFRRGGVLSIFFSLLCLCIFVRTHRCAPTFVCPCVLLSYCLAVGADWQLKLSLFFVIKREYPQGVGDKTNCSVAFNCFLYSLRNLLVNFSSLYQRDSCSCCCFFACVFWAHTPVRPYVFVFLFFCLIAFCRRGRPLCLPEDFFACVCFGRTHRCAPTLSY